MGDHRASISIQVEAHGVRRVANSWWINYFPEDGGVGLDRRVREFFEDWWSDAMSACDYREAGRVRDDMEAARRAESPADTISRLEARVRELEEQA